MSAPLSFPAPIRVARVAAFLLVLLAAALLAAAAAPGPAQAKDWRIENMDVVLDVQKDGDILVEETVTFAFEGSFSFVGRVIPTGNLDDLSDIQVFQNGQPLPTGLGPGSWDTFMEGKDRVIQVNFNLTDTSESWTFRYRAEGGIHFFDEGDEVRWYVFDADTPVPIDRVAVTVRLPSPVPEDKLLGAVQTGPSVEESFSSPAPGTLRYEAANFPPYTNFWIVAGFPKDVVEFHWTWRRFAAFAVPRVGFVLPIITFLGMILIWRRRGRDDPQRVFAKYVSEVPSDLPPGVAGALLDEKVDVKEVVATIVDLARRGYLEIIEEKEDRILFDKQRTVFQKLRPFDDLPLYERKVAEALFEVSGSRVSTDQLKNKFYKHVDPICTEIYTEVTRRGFFSKNPSTVRTNYTILALAVALVLGLLTVILFVGEVPGWGFFLVGSAFSAAIVLAFARVMPQRTPRGAQEQGRWEAFRNYLRDLGRYDDLATARETFERYLPYAVAFGVERDWVRRFQDIEVPGPTWYHPLDVPGGRRGRAETGGGMMGMPAGGGGIGGGGFSLDSMSDSLFSSLNSVSSVLTSAPSSSGSGKGAFGGGGGGFGGGFSGGGGGGGFRAG